MQVSVRLRSDTSEWTYGLAAEHEATLSATLMQVVEDRRTWWGLDSKVAERLQANASALGLTQRGYVYYLLRERARHLLEKKRKA